jgi:hypothetical protein
MPTVVPLSDPTMRPRASPSGHPSYSPTDAPSSQPSSVPSITPPLSPSSPYFIPTTNKNSFFIAQTKTQKIQNAIDDGTFQQI